jgi:hypothetical protein
MHRIRKRLTYANVMSSIAVFLVLGGAAFAASQLGKNSVGTKQLKKNAVNAAKLKKNAVRTAKIRNAAVTGAKIAANAVTTEKIADGSVTGAKIADGSVMGADINAESTPFGRVVARLRGNSSLALNEEFQAYGLSPSTYTQAAEEVDTYVGAVDVTFQPGCEAPRSAMALASLDAPEPAKEEEKIVGIGQVRDSKAGAVSRRIEIGPAILGPGLITGYRFEPGTAKGHTVSILVEAECNSGSGVIATSAGVDVIGTR